MCRHPNNCDRYELTSTMAMLCPVFHSAVLHAPTFTLFLSQIHDGPWALGRAWYRYLPTAKHSAVDYYQYPVQLWVPDWLLSTHKHNEASPTKIENNAVVVWTEMPPWTHVCECLSPQAVALLCVIPPSSLDLHLVILSSFLTSTDTPNRTPPSENPKPDAHMSKNTQ